MVNRRQLLETEDVKKNGANEIRTHDLLHAMQALSQLSYGPYCTGYDNS